MLRDKEEAVTHSDDLQHRYKNIYRNDDAGNWKVEKLGYCGKMDDIIIDITNVLLLHDKPH